MPSVSLSPGVFGAGYQSFLPTGLMNSGGLLYSYAAGTTTPIATYTTNAGNVANTNPIVLGADGRPPQEIWLDNTLSYKFVLQDSVGNLISTFDNIYPSGSVNGLNGPAFNAVKASPGYMQLPNGIIEQWGVTAVIPFGSSVTISYPLVFPTAVLDAQATAVGAGPAAAPVGLGVNPISTSQLTIYNYNASANYAVRWRVLGY